MDPTSPFSGGALLGDRVRMREAAQDTGIFIRSMASRGALGGLAHAASAAADVLDGAGYGWVIIETVGAGQTEVDIARLAHSVVVVEAPGLGDDIQAIKAGILEIADILVVNKQDLAGADQTLRSLADMLEARKTGRENEMTWQIPLLGCQATTGAGVEELASAIRRHADYLHETGGWQRRIAARQEKELRELIRARLYEDWFSGLPEDVWKEVLEQLAGHHISPAEAVKKLTGGGVTG